MPVAEDFKPLNPGGTAEKHPQMPVSKDEVQAGIPVEKEHTKSTEKARAIAVDHVVEIPDYYKRLEKLEHEAKEDGVKRADRRVRQLDAMLDQHAAELEAATTEANNSLTRQRVMSEIGAGVGGAFQAMPGLGFLLPSYSELRNDARSALEAQAEEHAQRLADLQAQHADQASRAVAELRSRALKTASYFVPQSDEELNNQQRGIRWGTLAGGLAGGIINHGTMPASGGDLVWQDFLPTLAGAKAGTQAGVLAAGLHRGFTDPILTTESGGAVPVAEGHMPGQGWKPLVGTLAGGAAGGYLGHEVGTDWQMGMHDQTGSQFTGAAVGGTLGALSGAAAGGLADKAQAQAILRARGIKVAYDQTQHSTQMAASPRGDELHLPMGENPYLGDPRKAADYENGFAYAQAIGHQALNQCTEGDVARWRGNENAWRDGFASACEKFGLSRVGDLVAAQPKMAGPVPSALEPAGHLSRGILATLGGVGGGVAVHSLWGDPGELYTLVPPALGAVAGGTILGDLGHAISQRGRIPEGAPITGTDDPRVRVPQALAALAGMGVGAGLGYLGGHYLAPESWHDTSGGHVPEIVGTSVGGVGGAIAGSALENHLSGRDKRGHYTLPSTEDNMTRIATMTDDNAKTANALVPLLGTLGGAAAGSMIAPHVSQLGDFIQGHHQGAGVEATMAPVTDPASQLLSRTMPIQVPYAPGHAPGDQFIHGPTSTPTPAVHHTALTPAELLHLERLYGAGIGGGLGLAGGLAYNAMGNREEQPGQVRTAAVAETKEAISPALAALLGMGLGGAVGGAVGHFAPGADQALAESFPADHHVQFGHVGSPDAVTAPTVSHPVVGSSQINAGMQGGADAANWAGQQGTSALNSLIDRGSQIADWGVHTGGPAALNVLEGVNQSVGDALNRHIPGAQELSNVVGPQTLGGAALGAGAGGLAGLGYALARQDGSERDPNLPYAPKLASSTDPDSDIEGSAITVLEAKVAALGTTLGTLAGIGGGALAGNYLAPAMHWAAMPGEHGALTQAQLAELQAAQAAHPQGGPVTINLPSTVDPGAAAQRGAEWNELSNLGRVMGAGVGGVAGYQAGRGIDEAFGLEKKERPLIVSPMARPA